MSITDKEYEEMADIIAIEATYKWEEDRVSSLVTDIYPLLSTEEVNELLEVLKYGHFQSAWHEENYEDNTPDDDWVPKPTEEELDYEEYLVEVAIERTQPGYLGDPWNGRIPSYEEWKKG